MGGILALVKDETLDGEISCTFDEEDIAEGDKTMDEEECCTLDKEKCCILEKNDV